MSALTTTLSNLMPQRLVRAALLHRTFVTFSHTNGLVYIGQIRQSDDHDPVRGFTAHTGQTDNHVVHGNAAGHDVTLLERTVTHPRRPHEKSAHAHTWLIAAIPHQLPDIPRVLLLSHEHPRLAEEAAFLHQDRSEHIALDYRLDALFLIYARQSDTAALRAALNEDVVQTLIAHPSYDFEFDATHVYVYAQSVNPSVGDLNVLLKSALSVTDAVVEGN